MLFELPVILKLRETLSDFGANPIFYFCLFVIIPFCLITSLIYLLLIFRKINSLETKTKKMREINSYINEGASVYLKKQAKMLFIVLGILFITVGLI